MGLLPAGDMGGTKTSLSLADVGSQPLALLLSQSRLPQPCPDPAGVAAMSSAE
ncbi:hypothetical protein L1047_09410 [Synechococcus sp. Nb3U1]|nr:hypothetical protein [Synechococcus sp. Nb3U1]